MNMFFEKLCMKYPFLPEWENLYPEHKEVIRKIYVEHTLQLKHQQASVEAKTIEVMLTSSKN